MKDYTGNIYPTNNCGDLKVVKYTNAKNVDVVFCDTGHKATVQMAHIKRGKVKDPLAKTILGVGFIGIGDHKVSKGGKHTEQYMCWVRMLDRCYNSNTLIKQPTYNGCTVAKSWHNFQTFAKWHKENYPSDGRAYHLDKDIRVKGNREYSEDACSFVTAEENTIEAHAKEYTLTNPEGDVVVIYNMNAYCSDKDLSQVKMSEVARGVRKSHKGWTRNHNLSNQ